MVDTGSGKTPAVLSSHNKNQQPRTATTQDDENELSQKAYKRNNYRDCTLRSMPKTRPPPAQGCYEKNTQAGPIELHGSEWYS